MAVVSLDDAAERAIAEVRSRVTGSWMNHHHENKQRLEAVLQTQGPRQYDNQDKYQLGRGHDPDSQARFSRHRR
jgi:hypothetical protein